MKTKVTGLIALLALAAVPALALGDTIQTGHVTARTAHTAVIHTEVNLTAGQYRASRPADPVLLFNAVDGQPLR